MRLGTKKIKQEILKVAEQAYRRGYQQGNHFAKQGVTQHDCFQYRYRRDIKKPWGCPERYSDGKIHIRMGGWKSLDDIHLTGTELDRLLWNLESALYDKYEGESEDEL